MECAEPEVNEISATYDAESSKINITADVRHVRTCADCGLELKSLDICIEREVNFTQADAYQKLSPEQQVRVLEAMKTLDGEQLDIECGDTHSSLKTSFTSRYSKNMIEVVVDYDLTVELEVETDGKMKLELPGSLTDSNPASAYEECC